MTEDWLPIRGQVDVEHIRRVAHQSATAFGSTGDQAAEWTLVASELATNLLRHTPAGGSIRCYAVEQPRRALIIQCDDAGPGIGNVTDAMVEGFTTAHGLGGGLSTIERFSDDLQIETSGSGTQITVTKWLS